MNRLDLRTWLFLGMGLAGILTVALIVTADESAAGIDGVRAVRALVPDAEQDHPGAAPAVARVPVIPLIGGLVVVVRDFAPSIFGQSSGSSDPTVSTAGPSPLPANSPSSSPQSTTSLVPAVQQPAVATAPPSVTPSPSPALIVLPSPSPTASPFIPFAPVLPPAPTATPTPTPPATPAGTLAISTDRGATAIVNLADLVPGDTISRTITVTNSGSLGFRYAVSATQTASTALWTDTADGIQLTVSTTAGAVVYVGPLSGLAALAGPTTIAPGTSETLRYDFAFPATASNAFQGLVQDLTLVFDAVQYP